MQDDIEKPELHSTRLFPKYLGADAYRITGIAARCDWVLLSDTKPPVTHLHHNSATLRPRHIFLSLRNPFAALAEFATNILPNLSRRFVLISGSEDVTLPQQCDKRWRSFNDIERSYINTILNHPLLVRWFAENLDAIDDTRFHPLPTGLVFPDCPLSHKISRTLPSPLYSRPPRILCGHRIRSGPQWEMRRQVTDLALTAWAPWCTVLTEEVSEQHFLDLMNSHAFVFCVEGGGLDPSPKAWQAILQGSIPIIRSTATRKAYDQLPVAFVPDWHCDSINFNLLLDWHAQFTPSHDCPFQRSATLDMLSTDYWWNHILELTGVAEGAV